MEIEKCPFPGRAFIIAREGWVFIMSFGVAASVFLLFGIWFIYLPLFILAIFTVYFFRNPERAPPGGEDMVIAPADGRVVEVADLEDNGYTNGPAKKVSIFMSIFDCHVNRAPVAGRVTDIRYHPGRFFVASSDKASKDNERNAILLGTGKNSLVAVVQIAGIIARRIACYLTMGDMVSRGQRLGLIRFGSRVELYLPAGTCINVSKGEKVKAGVTVMGRLT